MQMGAIHIWDTNILGNIGPLLTEKKACGREKAQLSKHESIFKNAVGETES